MKKVLIRVGAVVGLLAVFEVGLLFFPWSGPPHLVSRPLTLEEKNQRLWERFAPVPLWGTEAAKSQDKERSDGQDGSGHSIETEDLVGRLARLEARIARLEEHVVAQNSAIARLRSALSRPSMNAPYIPSMSEIRREIDSAIYNQSLRDGK